MTNVVKIEEIREKLSTSHFVPQSPKLELAFWYFLLKYEPLRNIKCKKVSETQEVLRNAIRKKLFNNSLPLLLIQSD